MNKQNKLIIISVFFLHFLFDYFFFNDTATTEIYTLSLHDALPISRLSTSPAGSSARQTHRPPCRAKSGRARDRKSTRLNSSHSQISYAVFCLKKKNESWKKLLLQPKTAETT